MKYIPGHDEVEEVEQRLFQSLSRDEPPVKARHMAAAALGLSGAALTGATAAEGATVGAAVVKASPLLLVKWVGIGTVAGVVSVGAIRHAMTPPAATTPKPAATAIAGPAPKANEAVAPIHPSPAAIEPPVTAPPEPAPVVAEQLRSPRPVSEPVTPRTTPAPRAPTATLPPNNEPAAPIVGANPASAPALEPAPNVTPVTPSILAAEVALLDQARAAVAAKNGERALDVLGRYGRQFPSGTLGLEATVLRIEALYLTGSSDAAAALGRDFLVSHPTSTHAARVRRLLADSKKP